MSSSDTDDVFGLGTMAPSAPSTRKAAAGHDARKELRVSVKWPARVLLSDGTVVPVTARDISESGIGLISMRPISAHATLRVALAVPDLEAPGRSTTVTGSFKTAHVTVSGPDLIYGGVWLTIDGGGRNLIQKWVRKLR
jgi:hypothetical protein